METQAPSTAPRCIRAAFQGAKIMKDENVLDNQALITYLSDTLWGIAP
ncbi:hypothetical protein NE562_12760 [Butyricicoccus faecihominis]|nr:hypothetical protein [Butyricicoccus faecihominis]MCQ5130536.1 hypothetical protein [Butyricicoccus faecihominis]